MSTCFISRSGESKMRTPASFRDGILGKISSFHWIIISLLDPPLLLLLLLRSNVWQDSNEARWRCHCRLLVREWTWCWVFPPLTVQPACWQTNRAHISSFVEHPAKSYFKKSEEEAKPMRQKERETNDINNWNRQVQVLVVGHHIIIVGKAWRAMRRLQLMPNVLNFNSLVVVMTRNFDLAT